MSPSPDLREDPDHVRMTITLDRLPIADREKVTDWIRAQGYDPITIEVRPSYLYRRQSLVCGFPETEVFEASETYEATQTFRDGVPSPVEVRTVKS